MTLFDGVKCQLGIHEWGPPTWIADKLPNIDKGSYTYQKLGQEQKCLACDKIRKVK